MATPAISSGIFGVAGQRLTDQECAFFKQLQPLGFIVFARNIDTPAQVKALVDQCFSLLNHPYKMMLIDQEGGRVARLRPPHWRAAPTAKSLGSNAQACYWNARLLGRELAELGINVDCAPVADLWHEGAHEIIGDRAFGAEVAPVVQGAHHTARGLQDEGVLPIMKHIPGHGRAHADSHLELPVLDTSLGELERTDFATFAQLRNIPMAMTAHVVYTALDKENPATTSLRAIEYIRRKMAYDGVLISDDLSMKALQGGYAERAKAALDAGCDVALHCNGQMDEMQAVAQGLRPLSDDSLRRIAAAFSSLPAGDFGAQPTQHLLAQFEQAMLHA